MGTRSPPRTTNGSSSNRRRLSDGLHKIPSALTLWSCEMTDLSPSGFIHHKQYHQSQTQTQNQQSTSATTPTTDYTALRYQPGCSYTKPPPMGAGGIAGGRLFSYFGNDSDTKERKKSDASFFNLGFRRKSNAYFAATD